MTVRAIKFTPEVLLSAPRRSAGVPNADGTRVLYTVSTYSFASHSRTSEVRVLDVTTQQSRLVTDVEGAGEPNWLEDNYILLLVPGDKGVTKVLVGDVDDFKDSSYIAGIIDGSAGNVKTKLLEKNKFAITVTAKATPDGSFYNPETAPKPKTSGRLYKSLYVRHWDTYVTPNRNSIWYGQLTRFVAYGGNEGRYGLSPLVNALKGTGLESPIPPFGGGDHYDLSSSGIIFAAKDPELNPATNTKCNVYIIHLTNFTRPDPPRPVKVAIPGCEGASTSPVFAPDGKQAAFLSMRKNGYESDKNEVFILPDVKKPEDVIHLLGTKKAVKQWHLSPQSVAWNSAISIYLVAEETGRVGVYYFDPSVPGEPRQILGSGTVTDIRPLPSNQVFVSGSSLIDSSTYYLIQNGRARVVSSLSRNGTTFGLSRSQIGEIWWPGAAEGTRIHAFIVKPSTFNSNEKYPLAYLIHGGPQGAWTDGWSTRWNPAVFAEQGYVVVCPNPTGSTGYGQAFTDKIQNQWGGLPYQDLVKGFEYIEKYLPYVDIDRAVALGASYGGYMINWIQGHELGRKFKALVGHDGVFSMAGQMGSEELYFPFHEFNGPLWENREAWMRWDPSRFTGNWKTPQLVIHSELDYRLTIAEGLAAFSTLQARGVESQFLTFPDENHWVLKPENSLLWHTTVFDWINGYVGLPSYSQGGSGKEVKTEALMDGTEKLKL